jgi:hypothetical protein
MTNIDDPVRVGFHPKRHEYQYIKKAIALDKEGTWF